MKRDEFKRQLDELQSVMYRGFLYHSVWQALWPNDDNIRTLNRFRAAAAPLRAALLEAMLSQLSKALDHQPDAVSLPNLLRAAREEMDSLVPLIDRRDMDDLSDQLSHDGGTLEKLNQAKEQHLVQLGGRLFEDATLRKADVDNLVLGVRSVFNRLSAAHDSTRPPWSPQEERAGWVTTQMLQILTEDTDRRLTGR